MTASGDLAAELEAGLRESIAHQRGDIALQTRVYGDSLPAERVKAIRKMVAKSSREFGAVFRVPHRTVEGWEQGRAMDPAANALFRLIEANPEAAVAAMRAADEKAAA